jgi:hypothetical protein
LGHSYRLRHCAISNEGERRRESIGATTFNRGSSCNSNQESLGSNFPVLVKPPADARPEVISVKLVQFETNVLFQELT